MADEPKTVVPGNVTPSGSPTAQQAPADAAVNAGFQARIDGFTAEKARLKAELEAKDAELAKMRADHMTEQEKLLAAARNDAIESFKKTEYEPVATRAKKLEAHFQAEVDRLKAAVPAEVLPVDFDTWPIEVRHSFLSSLRGFKPSPVGAAPNPATPQPGRTIPGSEFREWQNVDQYSTEGRNKFFSKKPEMEAAYREGRIDWKK